MQSVERECIIYIYVHTSSAAVCQSRRQDYSMELGDFNGAGRFEILMELGDFNRAWRFQWSLDILMELADFNGAWRI